MITGKFNLSLALLAGIFSIGANSYELTTHAELTKRAYAVSTLGSQLKQLGLVDLPEPVDRNYYDFTSLSISKRLANSFEASKMLDPKNDQYKIVGWLMRGAVREDDGGLTAGLKAGEPVFKDPDPSGLINRFCNHFLDPNTRNPLPQGTLCDSPADFGSPNGQNFSAVNWAFGTNPGSGDAFSANPQRIENFRNHFTIFNARETMWRALTLKNRTGAPAERVSGDTNEQVRKAYWASTFRALGDVLHLNQDMAQPQHTRAEGHGIGHAAVYEKYVDARAKRDKEFVFDPEGNITRIDGQLPPLPLDNLYPVPRFSRYSDYWSTNQGAASISTGKGNR